ncbi:MAG: T9SS type A sorting domain-containing protein [Rhodothermales bacterium]|nr:T9SS type A sorting domain-containing protein [Rhodothermales bacterium]
MFTILDDDVTAVNDVSADGSVMVGQIATALGAAIWDAENGWRNLVEVADEAGIDVEGWTLSVAWSISDDGQAIVGQGVNPDGDGEGWILRFEEPERSTDIIVNDTRDLADHDAEDEFCDVDPDEEDNQCTLRAAIQVSNSRGGSNPIMFNIEGNGPHTINVTTELDQIVVPVVMDATTQPGYSGTPVVALQGAGNVGLAISAGQSVIRGLAIGGFPIGIVNGGQGGNVIEACHIGLDPSGTVAKPNGIGITVQDTPDHRIGGDTMEQRNVISGNTEQGVLVFGASSAGTVISGNYIGINATGITAVPNGIEGIKIDGSPNVTIGGSTEGARNVISGNATVGVLILGEAATGNIVAANYIGTNSNGDAALANGAEGVRVEKAANVVIGGETSGERNVISGNGAHGVYVVGPGADGARIKSNYIGVDATGSMALGNGILTGDATGHRGIWVLFANDIEIGGSTSTPGIAPGNVVSDNAWNGIEVEGGLPGSESGSSNNARILGNIVGMDAAGVTLLANGRMESADGITISGEARDAIVGQAAGGNAIATNEGVGVNLTRDANLSPSPDGAHIAANIIGFTAAGDAVLGHTVFGISRNIDNATNLVGGISDVTIGGVAGEGNQIVSTIGIVVYGVESERNEIRSNVIGLLANGTVAPKDEEFKGVVGISTLLADGVMIENNTVGGYGIGIELSSNKNILKGNFIGTNPQGTSARPNTTGVRIPSAIVGETFQFPVGGENIIGGTGSSEPNVISGNELRGVVIGGRVVFNVFTDSDAAIRAIRSMEPLDDLVRGLVGSIDVDATLVESRSASSRDMDGASDNLIIGNKIGTNLAGTAQIGNGQSGSAETLGIGIGLQGGSRNLIIGNVISGNGFGVAITDGTPNYPATSKDNSFAANVIGIGSDGSSLPNQFGGILVVANGPQILTSVTITEGSKPAGNIIARNGQFGIRIVSDEEGIPRVQISQSSFERNVGPAIEHFHNGEPGAPHVPDPPRMLSALALEDQVRLRIGPRATGPVDVFSTTACEGGHADGFYRLSVEGTAGASGTVLLDYDLLPISTAEQATGLYLSTTSTSQGETAATSAFSSCLRIAAEGNSMEQFLIDGQTGDVFDGLGLSINVTSNSNSSASMSKRSDGTLYVSRYDLAPDNNTFDGKVASTDDGSIIEPNVVASDRYWTIRSDSLDGLEYTACLNISGIDGVNVPEQLTLARRDDLAGVWVPYTSTLEDSGATLCASGIESLGDLGVGADSLVNPIYTPPVSTPVETPKVVPDVFELSHLYPNPLSDKGFFALSNPKPGPIVVEVYDSVGRKVDEILNEVVEAGIKTLGFDASSLPAGVYFIRATGMGISLTKTATVVR